MTVPVPCPGSTVDVSSATPRKRRRRAPASGASDDCFSCSKSNTKCDRRRPYCSQCLEFGAECSGYKTQLTWGVGVASRGKLRGLSLPIARSAPAPKSPSAKHSRASTSTSLPKTPLSSIEAGEREGEDVKIKLEGQSPLPRSSYTTYDFINMIPNSPMSIQMPSMGSDWTMQMPQEYLRISHPSTPEQPSHQQLLRQSLRRLHTPLLPNGDDIAMSSSGSISGYSDTEYSPIDHSFGADDVPYLASPMPLYSNYSSQNSPVDHSFGIISDSRGPTSCPDQFYAQSEVSSSLSSHQTIYDMSDSRQLAASPSAGNRSEVIYEDESRGMI